MANKKPLEIVANGEHVATITVYQSPRDGEWGAVLWVKGIPKTRQLAHSYPDPDSALNEALRVLAEKYGVVNPPLAPKGKRKVMDDDPVDDQIRQVLDRLPKKR
jgi:hypothetical protein